MKQLLMMCTIAFVVFFSNAALAKANPCHNCASAYIVPDYRTCQLHIMIDDSPKVMVASALMEHALSWNGEVFVEGLDPAFYKYDLTFASEPLGSSHMCWCECYYTDVDSEMQLFECRYKNGGTSEGRDEFTGDAWCNAVVGGCVDIGCDARSVRGSQN